MNSVDCGEEEMGEREFGIEKRQSLFYIWTSFSFSRFPCIGLMSFLYTFSSFSCVLLFRKKSLFGVGVT